MYLGISTASFFNRVPNENAFSTLAQMGVPFAEVFLNTFYEYERPYIGLLTTKKGHINIHSVHALGTQFEPELFNDNSRVRFDAEQTFKKVLYAASILGARYYTFHGPLKLTKYSVLDEEKFFARLNELSDIALSMNVRLSYENVSYSHANEPEFFEKMLKACPGVTGTLDVKHALQAGISPKRFLDAMGKKVSTVHLCDYVHGKTYLPNRKSSFNFEEFFNEIEARHLNPVMLLEVYPKDYKDINELKASYDYLRSLMLAPKKENKVVKFLTRDTTKYENVDLSKDKNHIKELKEREKEKERLEKEKSLIKIREEKERIAKEREREKEREDKERVKLLKERMREEKKGEKTAKEDIKFAANEEEKIKETAIMMTETNIETDVLFAETAANTIKENTNESIIDNET
ncbi:MAG: sugar phosphate isomerase/epimerase [Firmicutes bacterium]|nr:sugar phosphate isomerase/epimerase [Bacillota bacterium]